MKKFMDEEFLLSSKTAQNLYENYAKTLPIIDFHSHVSAQEIYENRRFNNLTEAWLEHDHYKWRIMRARGAGEGLITAFDKPSLRRVNWKTNSRFGEADYEHEKLSKARFEAFAAALPYAMGNPVYHFSHLELKRYFDCDLIINEENAEAINNICNEKLKDMPVREIIKRSNVAALCTTDDPCDDLYYHLKLKEEGYPVKVLPSFRPDKAYNIEKDGWRKYIDKLSEISGINIDCVQKLKYALKKRIDFFAENGCKASDHGADALFEGIADDETAEIIFQKAYKSEKISDSEANLFRKNIMVSLCRKYSELDWVNEIHVGVKRNVNSRKFTELGADTGFDVINPLPSLTGLFDLFNTLEKEKSLPKTIIFSANSGDNALINTLAGSFQAENSYGKIVQGAAWWFNDTEGGIRKQLTDMAEYSVLGNFVGMLTDSRSFLSYTRHEYFRRILCDTIGTWVDEGRYPNDEKFLGEFIRNLCFYNAKNFFNF